MTKFFFKFEKPYFRLISPIFGAKKVLSKKFWLSHAHLHKGSQHHAKILKILMIQFQEKTWTNIGRKDRDTLFHRTLPATAGGPTSTTAVDWHLKIKDILTKNYCITVSMQKISSIHKLIFKL